MQEYRDRIAQLQLEIKKYDDASAHAKIGLNSIASSLRELRQDARSSLGYKLLQEESDSITTTLNLKSHAFQNDSASGDAVTSTFKRTLTDDSDDGNNPCKTDLKCPRTQEDEEMQHDPAPQTSKDNNENVPDRPTSSTQIV